MFYPLRAATLLACLQMPFFLSAQSLHFVNFNELKHTYWLNTTHALNRLEEEDRVSVNAIYQNYLGLLNEIRYIEGSVFAALRSHHQLGFRAHSLKEGPYIDKTGLAMYYAYRIKIMQKTALSAGAYYGMKSLRLDGATSNVSGSGLSSGLGIDLLIQHPSYFVFYSINEVLSSRLRSNQVAIRSARMHEVWMGIKCRLSPNLMLKPQINLRLQRTLTNLYGAGLDFLVVDKLDFGLSTYNLNSIMYRFSITIKDIWPSWALRAEGSYRQLIGRLPGSLYNNSLEIGLTFMKKKPVYVYDTPE